MNWLSQGHVHAVAVGAVLASVMLAAVLSSLAAGQSSPEPSVAPSAVPSSSPSAVPVPTWPDAPAPGKGGLTPGVLAWQPAGPPVLWPGRAVTDLVAWAGGFAAIEHRDDEARSRSVSAAIWHSSDGAMWVRSRLPTSIRAHGVVALLPFKGGLVLATDVTPDIRGWGFDLAFWRSRDARTWREVGRVGYRVPRELQRASCQANHRDIASIDGALMLYVGLCWNPCCGGFAPGQQLVLGRLGALSAPAGPRGGTIAWRSQDARRWARTPLRGFDPEPWTDYGADFYAWPDELLVLRATRWDEPVTLLRSNDGVRWRSYGSVPSEFDVEAGRSAIVPTTTSVLLAGSSFELEGDPSAYGNNLLTWVAEEGDTVGPTIGRQPASVTGAIRDGDMVLLIGEAEGPGPSVETDQDDEAWAWIMGSRDGGLSWDLGLSWTGASGSCIREAAQRSRTVVTLGCRPWWAEGTSSEPKVISQFWVAELPTG